LNNYNMLFKKCASYDLKSQILVQRMGSY